MKVGAKVREIPDESGWKMREGVGTVLKIYNVWDSTRIDVDYGDGGVYIYFMGDLEVIERNSD